MKQEVKAKWLEALRSGDYQQGYGALKVTKDVYGQQTPVKHCCLGVLCDISGQGEWFGTAFEAGKTPNNALLPSNVEKWSGITKAEQSTLANINDHDDDLRHTGEGNGYKSVINYIEDYL